MSEKLSGAGVVLFNVVFWGGLVGLIWYVNASGAQTCTNTSTAFQIRKLDDPTSNVGDNLVLTVGMNGTDEVCTRKDGSVASRTVKVAPINEVDSIGTKVKPLQQTFSAPVSCPITTCRDSSCSSSTGRGTCSWHGGIAY